MKRLTIRNSDGTVSQPYGANVEDIFYRLAEYEDTGLEPEEIVAAANRRHDCKVGRSGRWYAKAKIGVSDKTGTAIREGDILRQGKRHFVVCYTPDIAGFVARPEDGGNTYPCLNYGTTKILEVVGSVYDHEEIKLDAQEKNKGCAWCNAEYTIIDDDFGQPIRPKMIKFCWHCGSKLGEESI